ncbi:hypothetical protein [Halococcus salsus]|uniref:hypothetical protein n=1 Tax=Halococcus salsus TaxID=2162894 RepID=UPI001F034E91|nr:hypothetical protein [Halococcus salsus]
MRERQQQQGNATGNSSSGSGSDSEVSGGATPNFSNTVNAVEDLDWDPNGNSAIDGALSGISDGTLVVLPAGNYRLDGQAQVSGNTIGLAGEGYNEASGAPQPGGGAATIFAGGEEARLNFDAESGLMANLVLDQSQSKGGISFVVRSQGFVTARDIRVNGVLTNTGSSYNEGTNNPQCALIAESEEATARVERFVSRGTGLPGDKRQGGVPAIWVGDGNKGTAQIVDCEVQAATDNGIYGSRTSGDTQIVGGTYFNNEVSQIRFCGKGSFADGVTLGVDADNYSGPSGSFGGFNEKIGMQVVKVEQPSHISKPGGAVLRNAEIQARSVNKMGAVIYVRGHGGALKMDNCRVTNNTDQSSLLASEPGSSYDPASPPPHNITITNSLFQGTQSSDIVKVEGRPQSTVTNTCFQVAGASQSSLSGITVGEGVGFGQQCQAGLSDPSKVGSGGNVSSLPAFNASAIGSNASRSAPADRQQKGHMKNIFDAAALVVLVIVAFLIAVPVGVVGLGGLASLALNYILDDD